MMVLQSERLVSHAAAADQTNSVYELIASQLEQLIDRFGLQEQRRQVLNAYQAIARDSLSYPRRSRPMAGSAINHDGTPFQYAATLGVPSRILAFIGDVGPLTAPGAARMANSCGCLTYLSRSLGMAHSLEAVEELLDALAPADNTVLLGEPAGAFWISAGFALGRSPRLKIYINGRWGKEADRWQRLDRFATFFGMRDRWHGLAKELRADLKPLGMSLTFSSSRPPDGRIYLSAFGKTIAHYEHLARTACTAQFNNYLHQFASFLLADDIDFPTPTAVSSFGLSSGSAFDFKFELCAHCLFESDREAAHRLRSWFSEVDFDAAAYEDMLAVLAPAGLSATENNLHCYAGIGLKRGAPYTSIYLKPKTMHNGQA